MTTKRETLKSLLATHTCKRDVSVQWTEGRKSGYKEREERNVRLKSARVEGLLEKLEPGSLGVIVLLVLNRRPTLQRAR